MAIKKIRVIDPVIVNNTDIPKAFESELQDGPYQGGVIEVSQDTITIGTRSIESEYDEVLCNPQTLSLAIKAEREGMDAVVVNCMSDPALGAIREALAIPAVGPNQAAMHTANMLGQKFGIVVLIDEVVPIHEKLAASYGLLSRLTEVVPTGIHAYEIAELVKNDKQALFQALGKAAVKAARGGAHSIIIGCTGFLGCASGVRSYLREEGFAGIPVIDPIPNAILTAAKLCDLMLTQSKKTFPRPEVQQRSGYDSSWTLL